MIVVRWAVRLPGYVFFGRWAFLLWLLVYICLVPLFAWLFATRLNGEFYHTTAKFEAPLREDGTALIQELTVGIQENFRVGHNGEFVESNNWRVTSSDIQVNSISFPQADPGQAVARLRIIVELRGVNDLLGAVSRTPFEIEFPVRMQLAIGLPDTSEWREFKVVTLVQPQALPFDSKVLFPAQDIVSVAAFGLRQKTSEHLWNFWAATLGFPANEPGNGKRMLYLSAMTITTVGYGDVVPLTDGARAAVAVEAICGIAVAGFFVNAAFSARRPRGTPQSKSNIGWDQPTSPPDGQPRVF